MKTRFARLLIVLPFWYFALVINHHDVAFSPPFATEADCNAMITQLTTPANPHLHQDTPLFISYGAASACWSDEDSD